MPVNALLVFAVGDLHKAAVSAQELFEDARIRRLKKAAVGRFRVGFSCCG